MQKRSPNIFFSFLVEPTEAETATAETEEKRESSANTPTTVTAS